MLRPVHRLLLCVCMLMVVSACGAQPQTGSTVRVGGSSALWPLLEEAAVRYQAQNPGVTIAVARSSSGNGRRGVCGGQLDIGASDIPLSAEEQAQLRCEDAQQTPIAIQAFVPIAHTRGPGALTSLTKAQLVGIFSGSVTNWQEVGGEDQRIVVVNRVPSSGTRANMAAFLFDGDNNRFTEGEAQEESSGIEQLVSQTPGAISYVSLAYLGNPNTRPIGIDGVLPNRESIQSGRWPIGGPGYLITKGTPSGHAQGFIAFLQSAEFQGSAVYARLGFVPPQSR